MRPDRYKLHTNISVRKLIRSGYLDMPHNSGATCWLVNRDFMIQDLADKLEVNMSVFEINTAKDKKLTFSSVFISKYIMAIH